MDKLGEAVALVVTAGLATIALILWSSYLLNPSVAIAVIVALGGVFAYAKGRLDETISLLDEVAAWAYYPYYAACRPPPNQSFYPPELLDAEYLKGMAKENASSLAAASVRAARRMPDYIGVITRNHIELLRSFSLKSFSSSDETRDWIYLMFDSSEEAHRAIQHLEENEYRMHVWLPRWIANKYEELLKKALGNRFEDLSRWTKPRRIPVALVIIVITICLVGLLALSKFFGLC